MLSINPYTGGLKFGYSGLIDPFTGRFTLPRVPPLGGGPLPGPGGSPTINSVTLDNASPTVGDTITATVDATGADFITYLWMADGVDIPGAVSFTYTATREDAMGRSIICAAIAHNGQGDSAPFQSSPTAICTGVPTNTAAPVVTTDGTGGGTAPNGPGATGDSLTCTQGSWSGYPAPDVFNYQWVLSGSDISGAGSPYYAGTNGTGPGAYSCRVQAIATGVGSASADSNSITVVQSQ